MIDIVLDIDALEASVEASDRELERELPAACERSMDAVVERTRASRAYQDRTGVLDASTMVATADGTPTGAVATVVASAPYAGFIEHGTRHIRPRRFLEQALDEVDHGEHVADGVQRALRRAGF